MPDSTPHKAFTVASTGALARRKMNKNPHSSDLIQEEVGFHMGIAADLEATAQQSANLVGNHYARWIKHGMGEKDTKYRQQYFTIAVGGGNTVKAQYRALLEHHHDTIDWIKHVRFFFLEESSGEEKWESSRESLIKDFLRPLGDSLLSTKRPRSLARALGLDWPASKQQIMNCMLHTMIHAINLAEVNTALRSNSNTQAKKLARRESDRYQRELQKKLGSAMTFHMIISGIGKDGSIGALSPYTPALKNKQPGTIVLEQENGSLRVALNRGVFIAADCISLIISGNLKLKALGRFEMEESADFEQTVLETPLRMLRETNAIARKVYIFADEQALHVDETVFKFTENGQVVEIKAESREGEEENGIHILLMHGFMGLFSFTGLLLRLPSAWTVSALHRGSHAKSLEDDEIFPHYALSLRKAILKNWRNGRPAPIVGHSIAGVISDHLLLSLLDERDSPVPSYKDLNTEDQQLVDALRVGGIINLATWAPTDGVNTGKNIGNLISHLRHKTTLDYSGFKKVYTENFEGQLQPHELIAPDEQDALGRLGNFLQTPVAKPIVNGLNSFTRILLKNKRVQQRLLNTNSPYALRIVGGRLLKKISFYGMLKEVNASLHNPGEYQARHIRALDILLKYDIPVLTIVHKDDFLVSAKRHKEEHDHLVRKRMALEGVASERELRVVTRYVALQRDQEELPLDILNPHLLIMSTSGEGSKMVRQVTSSITQFVNENVARATREGSVETLASVKKWQLNRSGR
jgi:6-phosphogluconolactonase/glucosamine-6-phosphate isomerase/deaminase